MIVHHLRVNFSHSLLRDATTLLDCKKMIGGLKFDVWPSSMITKMHPGLQIERVWIRL